MIYLLRFDEPLGSDKHQAEFYLGYCDDRRLWERITEHSEGRGAAITRALARKGLCFSMVKTFPHCSKIIKTGLNDMENGNDSRKQQRRSERRELSDADVFEMLESACFYIAQHGFKIVTSNDDEEAKSCTRLLVCSRNLVCQSPSMRSCSDR